MDDYFHLSLMKSSPATAILQKEGPPPSMPADSSEDKDGTADEDKLELEDPVKVPDTTDPYNATGRFNIKDVDW